MCFAEPCRLGEGCFERFLRSGEGRRAVAEAKERRITVEAYATEAELLRRAVSVCEDAAEEFCLWPLLRGLAHLRAFDHFASSLTGTDLAEKLLSAGVRPKDLVAGEEGLRAAWRRPGGKPEALSAVVAFLRELDAFREEQLFRSEDQWRASAGRPLSVEEVERDLFVEGSQVELRRNSPRARLDAHELAVALEELDRKGRQAQAEEAGWAVSRRKMEAGGSWRHADAGALRALGVPERRPTLLASLRHRAESRGDVAGVGKAKNAARFTIKAASCWRTRRVAVMIFLCAAALGSLSTSAASSAQLNMEHAGPSHTLADA